MFAVVWNQTKITFQERHAQDQQHSYTVTIMGN